MSPQFNLSYFCRPSLIIFQHIPHPHRSLWFIQLTEIQAKLKGKKKRLHLDCFSVHDRKGVKRRKSAGENEEIQISTVSAKSLPPRALTDIWSLRWHRRACDKLSVPQWQTKPTDFTCNHPGLTLNYRKGRRPLGKNWRDAFRVLYWEKLQNVVSIPLKRLKSKRPFSWFLSLPICNNLFMHQTGSKQRFQLLVLCHTTEEK